MAAAENSPGDDTLRPDEGHVPVTNRGERTPSPANPHVVSELAKDVIFRYTGLAQADERRRIFDCARVL